MLQVSKRAALILGIASTLSPNSLIFCDASAMEAPQNIGKRTFNQILQGDIFTNKKTNKKLMFVVTDGNKYSTYDTDQGVRLTIQEVPGTGRCADYALGIDRKELLEKIKTALKEKNEDYKNVIEFLEIEGEHTTNSPEKFFESILKDDTFLGEHMLSLAGKLFKVNIEMYTPDTTSIGKNIEIKNAYGQTLSYTTIDRLKLLGRYEYSPSAPVIRIQHGGYDGDDFRRANTKHFRFLYNAEKMEPWEKEKVRLLEEASAGYYKYAQDKDRFESSHPGKYEAERTYEKPTDEMFRIQAEGLGWVKKTGIQPPQNQAPSEEQQIENAAQKLRKYVEAKADDEAMRNALYNEGIPGKIWNKAIEKAKSKFKPSEKQASKPNTRSVEERVKDLGMTMDEFRQNREQSGMTDEELLDFLGG